MFLAGILSRCFSLRAAVALLFAIAAFSVIGTIIPQHPKGSAPGEESHWGAVLSYLGLGDVFHSFWLIVFALLLCLELVVCSWRGLRTWAVGVNKDGLESRRRNTAGLSSLLIHLGVVVIVSGFISGECFGTKAYVEIPEGKTVSIAPLMRQRITDPGLAIHCNDFSVEYHDSGIPGEYRSELTFLSGEVTLRKATLLVNQPVSLQGVRYYQASYRKTPLAVIGVRHGGQVHSLTATPGEVHEMGRETFFRVSRIEEDLMGMGPAMKIDFFSPAQSGQVWVFSQIERIVKAFPDLLSRAPQFNPDRFEGYAFSLDRIEPYYVTGILIAHDPALSIVILGASMFLSGLLARCLFSSRQARRHKTVAEDEA